MYFYHKAQSSKNKINPFFISHPFSEEHNKSKLIHIYMRKKYEKKQENEKDMPYPNNNVNHVSNFPHLFSMRKNLNLHYDINPQTSISKRNKN